MAVTRLSDPTPRMTLPRALLSEALRLARSPLAAVHLVCGLAGGSVSLANSPSGGAVATIAVPL